MPPAVLTNDDLSTFLETSDEWITSRTGMKERRISHVTAVDLVIYGGVSNEELCPNSASGVQLLLGATKAAAIDLNTACTSFCYGLATATAMIRGGMIKNAVVIGVELISRYMDWSNRNVAVLFGDGAAAVVLQASDSEEGMIGAVLGCDAEARQTLRVRGFGCGYSGYDITFGDTLWDFDGQAIFKRAVKAMSEASVKVLADNGIGSEQISLVIPHQANLRIIEGVAKHAGIPMEKVIVTVHKYGNMSAATVPVALVEALEAGRVTPGSWLLMPAFGGGLTYCSLLVKWGRRVTPLGASDAALPPCEKTALEMVNAIRAGQDPHGRSFKGLMAPVFADARSAG
jgi:3-oxoacyl-[acyl-carrier-protein] synthase-3